MTKEDDFKFVFDIPPLLSQFHPCSFSSTPALSVPPLLYQFNPCSVSSTPALPVQPLLCQFNPFSQADNTLSLYLLSLSWGFQLFPTLLVAPSSEPNLSDLSVNLALIMDFTHQVVELYKYFVSSGVSVSWNIWSSGKEQFFSFSKTIGSRSPTTKREPKETVENEKRSNWNLTEPPTLECFLKVDHKTFICRGH